MDEDERSVRDLVEQCVDHVALSDFSSSSSSPSLDAHLLARFQRLKVAANPSQHRGEAEVQGSNPACRHAALQDHPSDPLDIDALGTDLASRLAALKRPTPQIIKTDETNHALGETFRAGGSNGDALEVEKLLQAAKDCVRLEKSHATKGILSDEEEVSDSDVDQIVAWAKDAAALEPQEEEEEEEEREDEGGGLTSIPTIPKAASNKKRGSRWKFW